ncbi:hypothetical protein [Maribacter sp.]|uniref:hypothetical protein n=1 Tax=Maribacter sp. TaxID=1897614 RepID=UPI0025BC4D0C|nr:hypothetical protein [Maribacter sp.]
MPIYNILNKIDFVNRYKNICELYKKQEEPFNIKQDLIKEILFSFDDSIKYVSKERMFISKYQITDTEINLGLEFKYGYITARLYYIVKDEWIIYNRFDFIAKELNSNYDRSRYSLPIFNNKEDLSEILTHFFSIYNDIKKELKFANI